MRSVTNSSCVRGERLGGGGGGAVVGREGGREGDGLRGVCRRNNKTKLSTKLRNNYCNCSRTLFI